MNTKMTGFDDFQIFLSFHALHESSLNIERFKAMKVISCALHVCRTPWIDSWDMEGRISLVHRRGMEAESTSC